MAKETVGRRRNDTSGVESNQTRRTWPGGERRHASLTTGCASTRASRANKGIDTSMGWATATTSGDVAVCGTFSISQHDVPDPLIASPLRWQQPSDPAGPAAESGPLSRHRHRPVVALSMASARTAIATTRKTRHMLQYQHGARVRVKLAHTTRPWPTAAGQGRSGLKDGFCRNSYWLT